MKPDVSNIDALFKSAHKENLYEKLLSQLHKDFRLANIDFNLAPSIAADQLKKLLHEKIYYLLLEKFDEYLHLLYVVDVPESAFKNINVTDVVEVADQMTFLVLQRELQKVRFKKKYTP